MRRRGFDIVTPVGLAAILLAIAVVASLGPPAIQRVITEALIYIVIVVGLSIFVGNSGVVSFGHVSFMVIAGYASALLTLAPHRKHVLLALPRALEQVQLPGLAATVVASLLAGLAALVVGWPLMRLRGLVPSMATFALLEITHVVAQNWNAVTGGRQALVGLPLDTTIWTALAGAVAVVAAAAWYQQTPRGALLRCSRENETAAESIGIDIGRERMVALVISAVCCGLGGSLFAHFLGTLNPNSFYLETTFLTLAMLVVGGAGSLTGAVAGVAVVSTVTALFRSLEQGVSLGRMTISVMPGLQEVVLALIMLAILLFRREGLCGSTELAAFLDRLTGSRSRRSRLPNLQEGP